MAGKIGCREETEQQMELENEQGKQSKESYLLPQFCTDSVVAFLLSYQLQSKNYNEPKKLAADAHVFLVE